MGRVLPVSSQNPVLLYTTVAISALHLLFDVLAFKNDVSFWSNVDTMEGLSSRSLILNEVMEFVILLYLFEEDASWLVKVTSVFVRCAQWDSSAAPLRVRGSGHAAQACPWV